MDWKLIKIDTTTISGAAGAVKCKNILQAIVDKFISDFGFTTTSNSLNYISADGTESTAQITYYTVLVSPNASKLWIGYSSTGCQLHHSVFAYGSTGSCDGSWQIINPQIGGVENGGWRGGLLTSWVPNGSANNFSAANNSDDTWLPADATRLCGYFHNTDASYNTTATFSTAAASGSANIWILYNDDCIQVYDQGNGFAGNATYSFPYLVGYINGKIFETVDSDDKLPQAKFGWIELSHGIRDSNNPNPSNRAYGLWNYPPVTVDNNTYYIPPNFFYRNFASTKRAGSATNVNNDNGGMGFFKPDGSIHNRNSGDEFFYAAPMNDVCSKNYQGVGLQSLYSAKMRWYPLIVGLLQFNPSDGSMVGANLDSNFKGILRTDLLRCYGAAERNTFAQYRWGTLLNSKKFVMGPCGCAFGWDPRAAVTDSPWHLFNSFSSSTSATFSIAGSVENNNYNSDGFSFVVGKDATGNIWASTISAEDGSEFGTINSSISVAASDKLYALTADNGGIVASYIAQTINNADLAIYSYDYSTPSITLLNTSDDADGDELASTVTSNFLLFSTPLKAIMYKSFDWAWGNHYGLKRIGYNYSTDTFDNDVPILTGKRFGKLCSTVSYFDDTEYVAGQFLGTSGSGWSCTSIESAFLYNAKAQKLILFKPDGRVEVDPNGYNNDYPEHIFIGSDQCVYLVGKTEHPFVGFNQNGRNLFVRKYDKYGNLLWTKQYNANLAPFETDSAAGTTKDIIAMSNNFVLKNDGKIHLLYATAVSSVYTVHYVTIDSNGNMNIVYEVTNLSQSDLVGYKSLVNYNTRSIIFTDISNSIKTNILTRSW